MSEIQTCRTCGRPYPKGHSRRKGECPRCYAYRRRHGVARPFGDIDARGLTSPRGSEHPDWKGDDARDETKRARAQRMYKLDNALCECCSQVPATDRHHKDDDTGNNERNNLMFLCRRCHMTVDGRLEAFINAPDRSPRPPKPCTNCGRPSKPLRKGRCHTCNEYLRRNGVERPYIHDGRREKHHAA